MKNIHVLPTNNYAPLVHSTNKYGGYFKSEHYSPMKEMGDSYQHIYITSDEEIKERDWYYLPRTNLVYECTEDPTELNLERSLGVRKIILTTDQDLIKDGVQAIDDDFLEWFVNNPSCESVEIDKNWNYPLDKSWEYKIIIPKEEPFIEYTNTNDWLMPWKVIDLREVCEKIAGGDFDKHPVYKEWRHQVLERSKGNDRGNLEWVGQSENTPLINNFLLENGFEKNEMVMYWICW